MNAREFIVRIHHEDGSHWAEVLDLPGCFASGDTLEELLEALEEAISLYLHDEPDAHAIEGVQQAPEAPAPLHMEIGEMRVKVPA